MTTGSTIGPSVVTDATDGRRLAPSAPPPARAPRGGALPVRERRPGWIALAVALIVGFAAVGAYLYVQAGAKVPVVVVVADVPAGQVVTRSDVSTVAVAGGVTAISGDHLGSVVGQSAAVHLLPNMLLQRSMLTESAGLADGAAEVGVAVRPGQIPAGGLVPGDLVMVVQLPAPGSVATEQGVVLVPAATVSVARADPAQTGDTWLTLVVPVDKASAVATASGAGRVAVVRVSNQ